MANLKYRNEDGSYIDIPIASGKSAYAEAVTQGFLGTKEQWIESLKGASGKSAYQSAVDGGYSGTEQEFNSIFASIGDIQSILESI